MASVEEALNKATEELGVNLDGGESSTESAESTETTTKDSESAKAGSDGEAGETSSKATDTEQDTEAVSDGEEEASGSVDDIVEAALAGLDKGATQKKEETSSGSEAPKGTVETKATRVGPRDIDEVDFSDKKDVQNWVKEVAAFAVQEAIKPVAESNNAMIQKQAISEARFELKELVKNHPDAPKYGKAIAEKIRLYPNMPLEEAYRLATYDANRKAGKQDAYSSMEKKKAANLASTSAKKPPESAKPIKSSRDAVLRAMEEHGV